MFISPVYTYNATTLTNLGVGTRSRTPSSFTRIKRPQATEKKDGADRSNPLKGHSPTTQGSQVFKDKWRVYFQGRIPSLAWGSLGYYKTIIILEWIGIFLYLATSIKKKLATPNKFTY